MILFSNWSAVSPSKSHDFRFGVTSGDVTSGSGHVTSGQLNYNVMRQNVLDEIQKPLLKPRQTQVVKTYQIVRDPNTYELFTFPDYKRYQLVYDKRVVDPHTFLTYPYGYQ